MVALHCYCCCCCHLLAALTARRFLRGLVTVRQHMLHYGQRGGQKNEEGQPGGPLHHSLCNKYRWYLGIKLKILIRIQDSTNSIKRAKQTFFSRNNFFIKIQGKPSVKHKNAFKELQKFKQTKNKSSCINVLMFITVW